MNINKFIEKLNEWQNAKNSEYKMSPKIKIDIKLFKGKTDPTQYDAEKNIILVKPSYNIEQDPEGWMVHEYAHTEFDGINDDKHYPENSIERFAYIKQFRFLKNTNKASTFNNLKDDKKFPTLSLKFIKYNGEWETTLKKYWELANGN